MHADHVPLACAIQLNVRTRVVQVAHAAASFTYGVMKTGRTTFYGGAPDDMNPNNPSYGTLDGSCGCLPCPARDTFKTVMDHVSKPASPCCAAAWLQQWLSQSTSAGLASDRPVL